LFFKIYIVQNLVAAQFNTSPVEAGKAWRGVFRPNDDKLEFFYDGQGFMSLEVDGDLARAVFYDIDGQALHSWSLSKSRRLQVDQPPICSCSSKIRSCSSNLDAKSIYAVSSS